MTLEELQKKWHERIRYQKKGKTTEYSAPTMDIMTEWWLNEIKLLLQERADAIRGIKIDEGHLAQYDVLDLSEDARLDRFGNTKLETAALINIFYGR